jgi:hypothetical protein
MSLGSRHSLRITLPLANWAVGGVSSSDGSDGRVERFRDALRIQFHQHEPLECRKM